MNKLISLFACVTLAGCATQVVPAGPNTYYVSKTVRAMGSGAAAKADLYAIANEWCAKRGLVMVPVSSDAQNAQIGRGLGSAELTFRAVPPGDPEIKRPAVEKPDYTQRVQIR